MTTTNSCHQKCHSNMHEKNNKKFIFCFLFFYFFAVKTKCYSRKANKICMYIAKCLSTNICWNFVDMSRDGHKCILQLWLLIGIVLA